MKSGRGFRTESFPSLVDIAERWGVLAAESKAKGRSLPIIDGLIAATALEHGLILVTRNVRDYELLGVTLFNPWEAA